MKLDCFGCDSLPRRPRRVDPQVAAPLDPADPRQAGPAGQLRVGTDGDEAPAVIHPAIDQGGLIRGERQCRQNRDGGAVQPGFGQLGEFGRLERSESLGTKDLAVIAAEWVGGGCDQQHRPAGAVPLLGAPGTEHGQHDRQHDSQRGYSRADQDDRAAS